MYRTTSNSASLLICSILLIASSQQGRGAGRPPRSDVWEWWHCNHGLRAAKQFQLRQRKWCRYSARRKNPRLRRGSGQKRFSGRRGSPLQHQWQPGRGVWKLRYCEHAEHRGCPVYFDHPADRWEDPDCSGRLYCVCRPLHLERSAGFHVRDWRDRDAAIHQRPSGKRCGCATGRQYSCGQQLPVPTVAQRPV